MDQPGAGTPSQCSVFLLDRERYTTVDLPCPPSDINSINNRGQITSTVVDSDGGFHGLIRDKRGRRARIDVPAAAGTAVFDINDGGEVVGVYSDTDPAASTADDRRGFLRDRGDRFTRLRVPGSAYTQAFGVNNRGQVVGDYLDRDGMIHGYLWDKGRFTTIDGPDGAGATLTNINDNLADRAGRRWLHYLRDHRAMFRRAIDRALEAPLLQRDAGRTDRVDRLVLVEGVAGAWQLLTGRPLARSVTSETKNRASGAPAGPGVRLVRVCLAPLEPSVTDDAIAGTIRSAQARRYLVTD